MNHLVTEDEIRSFCYCSEYASRGGHSKLPFQEALAKLTLEHIFYRSLEYSWVDLHKQLAIIVADRARVLHRDYEILESHVDTAMRNAVLWIDQVFKTLQIYEYKTLFAHIDIPVTLGSHTVRLDISGIFAHQERHRIRYVTYLPWFNEHGMENDPPATLKFPAIRALMNKEMKAYGPISLYGHNVSLRENPSTIDLLVHRQIDKSQVSKKRITQIKNMLTMMDLDVHYPKVPCRDRNCPYYFKCRPEL